MTHNLPAKTCLSLPLQVLLFLQLKLLVHLPFCCHARLTLPPSVTSSNVGSSVEEGHRGHES